MPARMVPERVAGLEHLQALANARMSVTWHSKTGCIPATAVLNMSGRTILNAMLRGMYVYEKYSKEKDNGK